MMQATPSRGLIRGLIGERVVSQHYSQPEHGEWERDISKDGHIQSSLESADLVFLESFRCISALGTLRIQALMDLLSAPGCPLCHCFRGSERFLPIHTNFLKLHR